MKVSQLIQSIQAASRSNDWRLSFVPFTIGCVYLWFGLFQLDCTVQHLFLFALAIVTTFGFAALGYFINEFFDQQEDLEAGKINKLSLIKNYQKLLLFVFICSITFLPWLYLPKDQVTAVLIALEILCFVAYSFPWIRLKKSTYLAGILDASYAYLLPSLLSYHTFYLISPVKIEVVTLLPFFVLLFFIGYRNILIHQVIDVLNDKKSGLITLPQVLGIEKTKALFTTLFIFELCLLVGSTLSFVQIQLVYGVWTLAILVYLWYIREALKSILLGSPYVLLQPFRLSLDLFYQLWFPILHLFLLFFVDWKWIILLPLHSFLLVKKDYLVVIWGQGKHYLWHKSVRPAISFAVNSTIYILFRLLGINLKKEDKSAAAIIKEKIGLK